MNIPDDCIHQILIHSTLQTVSRVARTCKKWSGKIKEDNIIWAWKFSDYFPKNIISLQIRPLLLSGVMNWLQQERDIFTMHNYRHVMMHYIKRRLKISYIYATNDHNIECKHSDGKMRYFMSPSTIASFEKTLSPTEYNDGDLYYVWCSKEACERYKQKMTFVGGINHGESVPYIILRNEYGKLRSFDYQQYIFLTGNDTSFPEYPPGFGLNHSNYFVLSNNYRSLLLNSMKMNKNKSSVENIEFNLGDVCIRSNYYLAIYKNGLKEAKYSTDPDFYDFVKRYVIETGVICVTIMQVLDARYFNYSGNLCYLYDDTK